MPLPAWLKRPWLHFLLLGTALFILQRMAFPDPLPVVGPLSEQRMAALQQQWLAATGAPASAEQLKQLVARELDRDMLFQHALSLDLHRHDAVVFQRLLRNMHFLQLAGDRSDQELYQQALEMRLHLGDEVVKRRMIQVLEQLLLSANPPAPLKEEELQAAFVERAEELRRPPRYSFEQLYFARQRDADIAQVITTITEQGLSAGEAREMSSPFLPGYVFKHQTPEQLARHFGAAFVMNFQQAGPQAGQWLGPIASVYGQHYLWVESIEPAREASLEEVRAELERDIAAQHQAEALANAVAQLRQHYELRL
ncbi:peptidyl-prolyl cis-trans isomerase [Parahaliea sp. F7430]|uniref:Peptidyl-prolyl cis-trans isomerase n=1 Tax=Sediminihaliea albiluteola TaxID=2758564 RepID=A0A7W2YIV5_9GAMM|nr:peptidylprolyl isomerase [Sediminihaliea albiluteola]MBA6411964.1 peptidyl-prolyl cis-trans isomerase [Sediminihaliea albiluteola]